APGTKSSETEIPAEMAAQASAYRSELIEKIVETDDHLLAKFLEGEEIGLDELRAGLRKATIETQVIPVLCGSALKNKGVQPMLDGVVDYLPSPLDVPPVKGTDPKGNEVVRPADD